MEHKRSSIISNSFPVVDQRNRKWKDLNACISEETRAEKAKTLEKFLKNSCFKASTSDLSLNPSCNIGLYHVNCDERYRNATKKYHKQFQREMAHLIANQPNMCQQYFLKRILCYKTSWPPLHTKRELNNFVTKFFQLTPREKRRVDYLMETNLS